MNVEQIALPVLRAIGERPRLSKQLFRFAKWGDPYTPERFSWPYPMFDKMTERGPVFYARTYQQWFISGYDEVLEVFRSPNASTELLGERLLSVSPYTKLSPTTTENFRKWLLINDPPTHTRLRGAVSRAFSPRRIRSYEDKISDIAAQLVSDMADDNAPDVVAGFTAALPVYAIAELLGLPNDRWMWLRESSTMIGAMLEAMTKFDHEEMNQRFAELDETFTELIAERRSDPQDDLISALVSDESELTDDEVVAMITVLMFAGHETTTGLMGNSIVALAKHPDQRSLLRHHPELIDNAIEELLRYDSPVQFSARNTNGPVVVGDVTIPAGSNIGLMIGKANRDPRRWSDGDELRLDRDDPKSISFGHGIHHCLGASLARLEMKVGLPAFLDAFGDYSVADHDIEWKRSHTLRGPVRLVARRTTARV